MLPVAVILILCGCEWCCESVWGRVQFVGRTGLTRVPKRVRHDAWCRGVRWFVYLSTCLRCRPHVPDEFFLLASGNTRQVSHLNCLKKLAYFIAKMIECAMQIDGVFSSVMRHSGWQVGRPSACWNVLPITQSIPRVVRPSVRPSAHGHGYFQTGDSGLILHSVL